MLIISTYPGNVSIFEAILNMKKISMTTLLTLDLGTTTGWASCCYTGSYEDPDFGRPVIFSGAESFQCDRYSGGGMRFLRFRKWLDEIKALMGGLNEVYFEEVRRHVGTDASHIYGGFMAHLTAWCEQEKIPYEGVPVGTIKRFICLKGNASKAEVMEAVKAKGRQPQDHNEADALALLYWRLERKGQSR